MPIAILDPFSGIAGDMTLGALVACGVPAEFIEGLPARLGLEGVTAQVRPVVKQGIASIKVDFDIPPQPHGRHVPQIIRMIEASDAPARVKEIAAQAFTALGEAEAAIHGTTIAKVHLHEVGAVDAILDIVGSVWGFHLLGVTEVYSTPVQVGDGTVTAAHGVLPVPAPATSQLLAGIAIRVGPAGSGELTTPTGAVLLKVLSRGAPPASYVPLRSGFGAGTKDLADRANVLRLTIAESAGSSKPAWQTDVLVLLAADVDDQSGELLAAAADAARAAGALDVVLLATHMKKGRPATRIEVLCTPDAADAMTTLLLTHTTTLGVRRSTVERMSLAREFVEVQSFGHTLRVKVAVLPDGVERAKPEFDDVVRVAAAVGQSAAVVAADALHAAQHLLKDRRRARDT